MMTRLPLLLSAMLLCQAACKGSGDNGSGGVGGSGGTIGAGGGTGGSGGSGGGGGGGAGGGGGSGGGTGTTTNPDGSLTASIGPFALAPGDEIVECSVLRLPNTQPIDITNIQTTLAPGSHHLIVYRSTATAESPPYTCTSFAGVFSGDAPVFIAESASSVMQLPTGVAYHFPAGQMIRLEAHYLNATSSTIMGQGSVKFTPGAAGQTYQPADIMFCGTQFGSLPPGQMATSLPETTYSGGNGVDLTTLNVFAFTSHEHHRGTDVKIWKSATNNPSASLIYENTDWANPPLKVLDSSHLLTFAQGEGLSWQCTYNTFMDTSPVPFGESAASNEMCFIWAYYYPSVGRFISLQDCVK